MRILTVMLFSAVLSTGFLAGCGDVTSSASGRHAARPSLARSSRAGAGDEAYSYIEVKKNGHTKLYRVHVNKGRRSIDLETVAEEGINTTSSVGSTCDDPTLPGCDPNPEEPGGGSTGIISGELEIDGTVTDTIETNEPWDPSYSTAGWDGTGYHCARRVDGVHFHWKQHYFKTEGESEFIGQLPSRTAGVVKGRYLLPPGPWLSEDGQARIWSGTVDANCYFVYSEVYGIMLIEWGAIAVYKFNGDYEEFSSGASFASNEGSQYGGQMYYSLEALQMWDPEAYAVVKAYAETNTCTDGWVIVIDGVRVC